MILSSSNYIAVLVAAWLQKGLPSWPLPFVWFGSATTAMLAAVPFDQNQAIVWTIGGFAFLCSLAANIRLAFFSKDKAQPQPFLVQLEKAFVQKEEFEALKTDVHNQLKEIRAYLHDEIHGIKDSQNAAVVTARESFETLRELISSEFKELDHKRSVSIAGLYDELGRLREKAAATEQLASTLNQSVHQLSGRIDAAGRRPASRP